MLLSDLLLESAATPTGGSRNVVGGETTDGAAPFAAMVLEALRDSEMREGIRSDAPSSLADAIELEAGALEVDVDAAAARHAALQPEVQADEFAIPSTDGQALHLHDKAGAETAKMPGRIDSTFQAVHDVRSTSTTSQTPVDIGRSPSNVKGNSPSVNPDTLDASSSPFPVEVVALGISTETNGRTHIASRHIASEAADLVVAELRTIVGEAGRTHVSAHAVATSPSIVSSPDDGPPSSEVHPIQEGEVVEAEVGSEESPDVARTTGERAASDIQPRRDERAVRHPSPQMPQATGPDGRQKGDMDLTPSLTLENDLADDDAEAQSERQPVRPESPDLATRVVAREVPLDNSDSGRRSAIREKQGASGKAVRLESNPDATEKPDSSNSGEKLSEPQIGQTIASQEIEFFDTEKMTVEAAVADPILDKNDEIRPSEGRANSSTDLQADRHGSTREVSIPRAVVSAAWLRAMMEQGLRIHNEPEGWNSVTMRLGEEDGTMTVRTKREDGGMAIQVAFSDPHLRTLAVQSVERLEAALRAQYDTAIDLSLSDSNTPSSDDEGHTPAPPQTRSALPIENETHDAIRRSPWARNEWVV